MFIYQAEQEVSGLAERISANTKASYSVQVQKWTEEDRKRVAAALADDLDPAKLLAGWKKNSDLFTRASINDSDLYFTKSILVSTNWNRNNDVFGRTPVWAARHTPSHKRTNLEHDERQLVGHITDTWALTSAGVLIPDNTVVDDLPNLYHIANGAVIYTNWENDDLVERTQALIEGIEADEKYVSMEALFSSFDYAVITPEEEFHVVARKEDTAFLTKHLTAYGGSGEFDGCKLGRMLNNITFCGKGYVDKPANPYSVIFNDSVAFSFAKASVKNPFKKESGVSILCSSTSDSDNETENTRMSDNTVDNLLKQQNEKLEAKVSELTAQLGELSTASTTEKTKALETQITALEEKVATAKAEVEEAKAEIKTLTEAKEAADTQLTEANTAKEALEAEIAEAKAATTKATRISRLVEGGYDKEAAETKVETFASLEDEQFEAIAVELVEAKKTGKKDDEEDGGSCKSGDDKSDASDDSSDDPAGEAAASEDTLNDAQPKDEPNLSAQASADDEEDDSEATRAELRKALASRLQCVADDDEEDSE